MRGRAALLGLFLLILGSAGEGQERRWVKVVEVTGSAAVITSPEEAKREAERDARQKAVERCGITVQSESFARDELFKGGFVHSAAHGLILEEEVLRWRPFYDQDSPIRAPSFGFEVTLRARVECVRGEPDPSYQVAVKLDHASYREGEPIVVHIRATKESWFTVLNLASDDQVYILYPNHIEKQIPSKAQSQGRFDRVGPLKELVIPSKEIRALGEPYLKAYALPGRKTVTERILVIATKEPMELLAELPKEGKFSKYGSPMMAINVLSRWLSRTPVKDRAEASASFEIHAR